MKNFNFPLFAKIGGIALCLLLFLGIVAFFSFQQVAALQERDAARTLQSTLLQMSRLRADFAVRRDSTVIPQFDSLYQNFVSVLQTLPQDSATNKLFAIAADYRTAFTSLQQALKRRGYTEKDGIEGKFRASVHELESILQNVNNAQLTVDMLQARRSEKDYLMRKDTKYIAKVEERISSLRNKVSTINIGDAQLINNLADNYVQTFKQLVAAFAQADNALASCEALDSEALAELVLLVEQKSEAAAAEQSFMVIVISLSILFGMIFSFLTVKNIVRPINQLQQAALAMSQGKLDVQVHISTSDEIGMLAETFNAMASNIAESNRVMQAQQQNLLLQQEELATSTRITAEQKEYLHDKVQIILQEMQHFAEGNLTVSLPMDDSGDIGQLFAGFNDAVQRIHSAINEVAKVTENTDVIAHGINENTENLVTIAKEQWRMSEEVNFGLAEMNKAIHTSSQLASETAVFARVNGDKAHIAGNVVTDSVMQIKDILQFVQDTTKKIEHLGNQSQNLGEIVGTIDAIAKQTNLLALNAAIESARAGEHGRGFAVVAEKVADLSSQTAEATRRISEILRSISGDITSMVQTMQQGSTKVSETATLADSAGIAIRELMASADDVRDRLITISSAIEEQSAVSEQILASVQNLSRIASGASQATEDVAYRATDLATAVSNLSSLVLQFNLYDTNPQHIGKQVQRNSGFGKMKVATLNASSLPKKSFLRQHVL